MVITVLLVLEGWLVGGSWASAGPPLAVMVVGVCKEFKSGMEYKSRDFFVP